MSVSSDLADPIFLLRLYLEKRFGNPFLKEKNKEKDFSDLLTLIFLGMSLETHTFF